MKETIMAIFKFLKGNKKESKSLIDIKQHFDFLVSEFNYELTKISSPFIYSDGSKSDRHVCIFINDMNKLQLEIIGGNQWFHCHLRKYTYGSPSPYNDNKNSFGFQTFAKIEKTYDHKDYVVLHVGWEKVLQNTVDLIRRHKSFFSSEQEDEIDLFDQVKYYAKQNNFEFNDLWEEIGNPFFLNLIDQISPILNSNGYHLLRQSSTLAPYDETGLVDFVEYQNNKTLIRIAQSDWRDAPYIYCLIKNNKLIFELDLRKEPNQNLGIQQLKNQLRSCI